jgi:PQQ-dependent catabolism-associated CXXCW motif protein
MTAIMRRFVLFVFATLLLGPVFALAQDTAEPNGYRTENYRAPTPATLPGARVVTTAEARRIWEDGGAIFLDVLPHAPRPANLPPGTIWREKPRLNIPGSVWLPDTGYGALAPATENYLRSNVARLSAGDRAKMLVVYCQSACWMSWNAAKRILAMGYINIAWYPDGTDGWQEADLPLEESRPEPQRSE